ncbi:unnamed protein product [Dicrocoelium dendriticum]|nr:unnamed protein product [Dicrocoelium dendriticum]
MFKDMFGRLQQLSRRCIRHYHASMTPNQSFYDIVVVGGGMTGLSFCALAANSPIFNGKRILLLESAPYKPYLLKDTYETRTVALSRASQSMLEAVGAWDFVRCKRMQPVNQMKIWEDRSDAYLTFENGPLAYIVENGLVTESLRMAALKNSEMFTMKYGTLVKHIQLPPEDQPTTPIRLTIEDPKKTQSNVVETFLLVGADGIDSTVREAAGLKSIGWSHGQSAVVASLCMSECREKSTAWQKFTTTGPIALLPLSDRFCCLIWSTTNEESEFLMALTEDEFVHRLNEVLSRPSDPTPTTAIFLSRMGRRCAKFLDRLCGIPEAVPVPRPISPHIDSLQQGSTRKRFPLGFKHTTFYHAPGVALVGDAAHQILPLAGQGVNLGFGDVMCLVRKLEKAIAQGSHIGTVTFLQEYTTERQRAVLPIMATMEALNLMYSTSAYCSHFFASPDAENRYPMLRFCSRILTAMRASGVDTIQSSGLIKKILLDTATYGRISSRSFNT